MAQDALSQVLDALRMRGTVYFHADFRPPWGVRVPAHSNVARFHMAMRGRCWLRVDGVDEPLMLSTGDLAVIPYGAAHVISDLPDRAAEDVDTVVSRSGYTGDGALIYGGDTGNDACKLFCGHFEFDEGAVHPVLTALPRYIHIPNTETMNAAWLESVMRFVSAEVLGEQAGANAIVHRLTEIIFIQVVRAFVARAGDGAGSLAGLLDPQLARALAAVHAAPETAWTVESMAAEAGLSRTLFAERFTTLIGMTPMAYVTQWRMQQARRLLIEDDRRMIQVAEAAGYASEAAFVRAFKRHFGVTPGAMRAEQRRAPVDA